MRAWQSAHPWALSRHCVRSRRDADERATVLCICAARGRPTAGWDERRRVPGRRLAPVGVLNVCRGDGPWQRRHACVDRRAEGAGVDVVFNQQYLHQHMQASGCIHESNQQYLIGSSCSSPQRRGNLPSSAKWVGRPLWHKATLAMIASRFSLTGAPPSRCPGHRWDPASACSVLTGTVSPPPKSQSPPLSACPPGSHTAANVSTLRLTPCPAGVRARHLHLSPEVCDYWRPENILCCRLARAHCMAVRRASESRELVN